MDTYSMESFINWCDDITIANEGLKDKIKEFRNINLNAAVVANNIKDVKKFTFELKPLIQIPSDMQSEIKKKIVNNSKYSFGFIWNS